MIIIDSNILISALIKDSVTRKILIESNLLFFYPEISIAEVYRHRKEIQKKAKISEPQFNTLFNTLLENITLIPTEILTTKIKTAATAMQHDVSDAVFLAAALVLHAKIWSDDKDFDKQKLVKVVKTPEMLKQVLK